MFLLTVFVAPIAILVAAYFTSWARSMLLNYTSGRSIGVPVRVIPFSHFNPFWALVDRRAVSLLRCLPFLGENSITRYGWRGWDLEDRWRTHSELGDVFITVSPGYNVIQLNDPEAIKNVFRRNADFPRPAWVNDSLGVFGPNISSSEGQSWKVHRRVATRCFNEPNNEIVWYETLGLADDMIAYWSSKISISSSADDVRTLALSVLARAGFGKSHKFRGHEEKKPATEAQSMSYRESLGIILENLIVILALGPKTISFLARYWLPLRLREVNQAVVSFQKHMTTLYEDEKRAFAVGETTAQGNNLMTLMVRVSQEEAADAQSGGVGLTEREIYGNMFAFNFAGHDTTAHTSTFALYFLAANPDVQDWISEEIHQVLGDRQPHELDYRADFPRLKRCLAVLYETLRLYTIVPAIRWTGDRPTTLTVGEETLNLPAKTVVLPSYASVHTNPKYWGPDSLDWRPARWIVRTEEEEEEMDADKRGLFWGWSEGIRDCPGKKFSHVEFVALMVGLFRQWRVDPAALYPGESAGAARQRVLDLIRDDAGWVLLLQMRHPERAPLMWRNA